MNFTYDQWGEEEYARLLSFLSGNSDPSYREFHTRINPSEKPVIGVRTPLLRSTAKSIAAGNWRSFLDNARDDSSEELALQAFVMGHLRKITLAELLPYLRSYIPKVRDWAACDRFCSELKLIRREREVFLPVIDELIASGEEWRVRQGLVFLLCHYMTPEHLPMIFGYAAKVDAAAYYVSMGTAWLIATVVSYYPEQGMAFLRNWQTDGTTYNRTIRKITESFRVSPETKKRAIALRR